MKLHSSTHTVEKSGNFEENQFSIEASAKAFMILSDGLYSNKILAVIRELSTNAYDSHVDAGRRVIHLTYTSLLAWNHTFMFVTTAQV